MQVIGVQGMLYMHCDIIMYPFVSQATLSAKGVASTVICVPIKHIFGF